jgi:hypothetical protein
MKRRMLFALVFCAAAVSFIAAPSLYAAPTSKAAAALASAETSSLLRAQYSGCGWDYACPPRPWYGRRSYRTPQVYIENNYGSVNVYRNGRYAYPTRRSERRYPTDCGDSPCVESCGVLCWYRRIRDGYCGHGCESYREQARYEREYEDHDYSRRYYYRSWRRSYEETPPEYRSWRRSYEGAPPVRFERPSDDERVPLRPYRGPKYP